MRNLTFLLLLFLFAECNDATFESEIKALQEELSTLKAELSAIPSDDRPGLIHSVFFWLKDDLSESDQVAFLNGCRSLATVSTIKNCYIGPPASTENRDVVDHTYDYALLLHFENQAGQDAYQKDPIHLKFIEDNKDKWTKVIVYDSSILE